MNEELLEKFTAKIAPYRHLWKSLRLVCFGACHSESWVAVALRISLSELPVGKCESLPTVDDFLAASIYLPIEFLEPLLGDMIVGGFVSVPLDAMTVKVHLNRELAGLSRGQVGQLSWFGVVENERRDQQWDYGSQRPAITVTAWGERRFDVLSDDKLSALDAKLRIGEPPYDGLTALLADWMPGVETPHDVQSPLQIVAPIPFDMEYDGSGVLRVRGPADPAVDLRGRVFYRPGGIEKLTLNRIPSPSEEGPTTLALWETTVPWPRDSTQAKIVLFLGERQMDSLAVTRWPSAATVSGAMNLYFDPEHKRLRESVFGSKVKDGFERGVVQLLNLLGIPAIWYGQAATQGRPDFAALITEPKTRLVVLGECTRERPDAKFSGLAQRAQELQEHLSGEVGVLPIVFTCTRITDSEIEQAIEHNVSLIGQDALRVLFDFLEAGSNRSELLQYLGTMQSPESSIRFQIGLPPRK